MIVCKEKKLLIIRKRKQYYCRYMLCVIEGAKELKRRNIVNARNSVN